MINLGDGTFKYQTPPSIIAAASVVGKKEGEGPLGKYFDVVIEDIKCGEKTWERAESRFQKDAVHKALDKAGLSRGDIDLICAGDLLNQCAGTSFGLRELGIPFLGLFGACSTMAEGIVLSSLLIDGGAVSHALALTSSHFCSAERQFRLPLECGKQRTPTAQWTATGAGAVVLGKSGEGPFITHGVIGKIIDKDIKDPANMGAAMAPAAYHTLRTYFENTGEGPEHFDMILSGDLGLVGKAVMIQLFEEDGITLGEKYDDCGCFLFDIEGQDVHAGASGCGCAASVFASYVMDKFKSKEWNRILFMATGALMSTTTQAQGESIPAVAHAFVVSNSKN